VTGIVKTVAIFMAHADKAEVVREALLGMAGPSRKEAGNLRWDLWTDPAEPHRFVVDELYKNANAVFEHRRTPHYKQCAAAIKDVADRIVVSVEPIEVA
jgi:quinol monooxygenase YgiN